jgi:hypothetical protein
VGRIAIDEASALCVSIDLTIDRATGNCRWVTRGMRSAHDIIEQDLIYRAMRMMLDASTRATEAESKSVN